MGILDFFKTAIDGAKAEPVEENEEEINELIEKVAQRVVNWRMSIPAIMVLESGKPLSFVASQVMVFFEPIVQSIFSIKDYETFIRILEDRDKVELLIQRIEELEDQFQHKGEEESGDDEVSGADEQD